MTTPESGQIFHHKYELKEQLGGDTGSMLFRATDTVADRDVAIKILVPTDDGFPEGTESRFQREVKIVAKLRDPHNITMYDFGRTEDGLMFVVFEYVPGVDLAEAIATRAPMGQDDVVHILHQVIKALKEAHASDLLHRDIKPSNIRLFDYMGDSNRVKLLDFGIAKPVEAAGDMAITRAGALVGTPRYMSPEQIVGTALAPSSDIYSLGLVVFEMITGEPAIEGDHRSDFIRQQMSDQPLELPPRAKVGAALRAVVEKMIAREARDRFQTLEEIEAAIQNLDDPAVDTLDEPGEAMQLDTIRNVGSGSFADAPELPSLTSDSDTHVEDIADDNATDREITRLEPPPEPPGTFPPVSDDEVTTVRDPSAAKTQVEISADDLDIPTQPQVAAADHPDVQKRRKERLERERQPTPRAFKIVEAQKRPPKKKPAWTEGLTLSNLMVVPVGLLIGAGVVLGLSAIFGGDDLGRSAAVGAEVVQLGEPVHSSPPAAAVEPPPPSQRPIASAKLNVPEDGGVIDEPDEQETPEPESNTRTLALSEERCGKEPKFTGERKLAMQFGNKRRSWIGYLPKNYDPNEKHPVLVLFHSAGEHGRMILEDTAMMKLADREGLVVLAPNANRLGNPSEMMFPFSGADEGEFVRKAIYETSRLACLDPQRVFAIGHSLGGRIAERLPCYMPLSGIATTGFRPLPDESVCEPIQPVPYLQLWGNDDRYLSVNGGPNCIQQEKVSQTDHMATWRYNNRCESEKKPFGAPKNARCHRYDCEATFATCEVDGGRDWPTAKAKELEQNFDLLQCHSPPADFPYGEVIWKFFEQHGRTLEL